MLTTVLLYRAYSPKTGKHTPRDDGKKIDAYRKMLIRAGMRFTETASTVEKSSIGNFVRRGRVWNPWEGACAWETWSARIDEGRIVNQRDPREPVIVFRVE